ncbi:MAG: DUF1194 domain-containing protein [Alphaproteobacteria bacterium]|nr:DUF1194 domain-containing protein [Alphaproteobacteria bacterium]
MRSSLPALLCACLLAQPAEACRQALILGLDVSSSVDRQEYALQRRGLALALTDSQVAAAMIGGPGNELELAVFEWSGHSYQSLLVDWTSIDSTETLQTIANRLFSGTRTSATRPTAIGEAMLFAQALFAERPDCLVHTLDLSGDGKNNDGAEPDMIKPLLANAGVVINGLVIGIDQSDLQYGETSVAELTSYYQSNVITGPFAFVETALGFEDYRKAIKQKLLREMIPALAQMEPAPTGN